MLTVSEVKKLLKQGLNDGEIGDKLGYSKYQIHRFRKANNIPSYHEFKMLKTIDEIQKLNGKCYNQEDLANKVGLSQNRVSEIIKKYQLEINYKKNGKCIVCGNEFKGWGKFCSDICRRTKTLECIICGNEFKSAHKNKTCSAVCEEEYIKLKEEQRKNEKREERRRRRALKNNTTGNFTEQEFKEISLRFFDWKCAYTGEPLLEDLSNCHREHVVPLTKGGDNGIWNIVPSLDWVNLSKNNSNMEEWYRKQSYFSEERLEKIYDYVEIMSDVYGYENKLETQPLENKEKLEVEVIVDLLKQGFNDTEIGEQLGYTTNQIYRFRTINNIPNFKYYKNLNQIKEIKKLMNKCKTQKELAEKLNMSLSGLNKVLKKNNIEFKKKPNKYRKRKFGTWTIIKRLDNDNYNCKCDCGFEKVFTQSEIKYNSTKCPKCKMEHSFRTREKMFLADYKRAEKLRQKELKKRGKSYIINNIKKIDELGRDTYVNLICPAGHQTKNKFNRYDGCRICK